MDNIPISAELINDLIDKNGLPAPGFASIREISFLVNLIEKATGIRFIRMEMGVPGLPAPL